VSIDWSTITTTPITTPYRGPFGGNVVLYFPAAELQPRNLSLLSLAAIQGCIFPERSRRQFCRNPGAGNRSRAPLFPVAEMRSYVRDREKTQRPLSDDLEGCLLRRESHSARPAKKRPSLETAPNQETNSVAQALISATLAGAMFAFRRGLKS
jgi:hypothetical protein